MLFSVVPFYWSVIMEFNSWQTLFDEFRVSHKDVPEYKNISEDELYTIELENILATNFKTPGNQLKRMIRLAVERIWIKSGKPYYNVHPKMVESLCKVNLEKIPSEFVEIPANLDVVCFRFSDQIPTRYVENTGFVAVLDEVIKDSPVYCKSVLFSRLNADPEKSPFPPEYLGQFILIIDEGFRVKSDGITRTLCNMVTFSAKKDQSITDAIKETINNFSESHLDKVMMLTMGERLSNLLKVVISSGFMANSLDEGLVVPDVLSKDRVALQEAERRKDTEKIKQIVERAHRRGKLGYNIGTNEMFVATPAAPSSSSSEATGKELEYSHIRGGHPHAVRYGTGKNKVKIKWFRPTRVRPDLPFKG